jgi:FkbM family methyltransferase
MSINSHLRLFRKKRKSYHKGEIELLFVRFLCSRNGVSIDIGANKGNYSLELSKHSKKVICIEPNQAFNSYLKKMPSNCEVQNFAITNKKENIYLHAPISKGRLKYNTAFISTEENIQDLQLISKVKAKSLDDFMNEKVAMVKIDVEGGEMDVLNSGRNLIDAQRPNFLIESLTKDELRNQIDFFKAYNYVALKIIRDDIFFVSSDEIFNNCREVDRNTIFIPA